VVPPELECGVFAISVSDELGHASMLAVDRQGAKGES
jgi:hypothetical protein